MIPRYLAEEEALDSGWKKPDPGSWIREVIVKYDPALPCRGRRSPGSGMEKTESRILDPWEEIVKYDPALPCRGKSPGSGMEKTGSRILDSRRNSEV